MTDFLAMRPARDQPSRAHSPIGSVLQRALEVLAMGIAGCVPGKVLTSCSVLAVNLTGGGIGHVPLETDVIPKHPHIVFKAG